MGGVETWEKYNRKGICIDHTKDNIWRGEYTFNGQPVVNWGNPWVFVPSDGKVYTAPFGQNLLGEKVELLAGMVEQPGLVFLVMPLKF